MVAPPGLHLELTWQTPADADPFDEGPEAGADLDLHLLGPRAAADGWFALPNDCFWFNPRPQWGSSTSTTDDPILDRDDTDGWGPENLSLPAPEPGPYRIGVHAWNEHHYGPSSPRLKVYLGGVLVYDRDLQTLGLSLSRCDLWEVGSISFPPGRVVESRDGQGGPLIRRGYGSEALTAFGGCP